MPLALLFAAKLKKVFAVGRGEPNFIPMFVILNRLGRRKSMKRRASPGFLSMPAARRISGRVGQALFLVIVLSPLSSCAEKVSFYQDAFEMNQVRITGESAEQAARDSEQASVRLAEQNAELRKVLERLSREVEKTEQEAEQCRARMERLGVKVSGSSPSPTGSEEKKGPR